MTEASVMLSFDINGIKQCQRNRYPVLLIDQVVDVVPGKSAKGIKCFSYNEWYFPGHFDDEPNVPGFIQIECLVQTFIMTFLCLDEYKGKKTNFASINNVKFRRKIVPGETLIIDAELKSLKRGLASGSVSSTVNGEPACSAEFVVTVPDVFSAFKPR
ncbi:MAG: 3-hydroxyacyl-ACP dehydratase FabZ [Curvibacter sp.]|jgi:3-hydroxyacyl-[acyl-carrier-protein] dehydratase|nr:3-hydroxyacyl-ACP dehydratase FabZ [Curvibacter sp.]